MTNNGFRETPTCKSCKHATWMSESYLNYIKECSGDPPTSFIGLGKNPPHADADYVCDLWEKK